MSNPFKKGDLVYVANWNSFGLVLHDCLPSAPTVVIRALEGGVNNPWWGIVQRAKMTFAGPVALELKD